MTQRLYYADPYCASFSARVIEQLTWEGHPAALLDRTFFYPASGGQPADRGMLGGVAVVDVAVRDEDGAVVHVLERSLPQHLPGEVEGRLDWARRFDHMQQHTGQHILSAAFEQALDADTVGFHLGAEVSTVDINLARLDSEAVMPVEDLANRVVWENGPVDARFVDPGELALLSLRRPPAVEGPVRIVEIAGPGKRFDANPCGGTHVARTGEVGLIKIVRLDHRGEETRVAFVCGGRALRDYRAKGEIANQLSARLTVGTWELEQAVERMQDEVRQLRHDLRRARQQLLQVEGDELARGAVVQGPHRLVCQVWERREPEELRALAQRLAQNAGLIAMLAGVGERTHLCFACADGLEVDMAAVLGEACRLLGGKGGGQSHLAQGSVPVTDPARVEAVLASLLPSLGPDL